jgi:hypothetical protein
MSWNRGGGRGSIPAIPAQIIPECVGRALLLLKIEDGAGGTLAAYSMPVQPSSSISNRGPRHPGFSHCVTLRFRRISFGPKCMTKRAKPRGRGPGEMPESPLKCLPPR